MRLRQIALVGEDLAACEADIRAILGLEYAYDDPGVGAFGLKNAVFPVGETFLEVVSPKQEGTTAGRLLEKRGGDGGYMAIFQVRDIGAARGLLEKAGARTVSQVDRDGVHYSHIHPKDIGGAIVSVDEMDPWERWEWGGPVWRDHIKTDTSLGIVGAEIQTDDPKAMATRWSEVLGQPVKPAGDDAWRMDLDAGGEVRFVTPKDGRGEGLGRFDVAVRDPDAVRAAAKARGKLDAEGNVVLSGTRVRLVQA